MKTIFTFLLLFSASIVFSQKEKALCSIDQIIVMPDKMPEFPGGDIALKKYIATHFKQPKVPASEVDVTSKIYVKFCVNMLGKVERVKVVRSSHPKFNKQAVKVVESLPDWSPGIKDGKPVCVWLTTPVKLNWNQ